MVKLNLQRGFLLTLNQRELKDLKDYYRVLKLCNSGLHYYHVSKTVGTTRDKAYSWIFRKTRPKGVKIIEAAQNRGYFKYIKKIDLEWLGYLLGYNLGDGNISRDYCHTWFYGVNTDLVKIGRHIITFKVKLTIYTYKINNGKMVVNDSTFSRFLCSLGSVKGDKTKASYLVPKWIFSSKGKSIYKKRFLQGLCDAELSRICLFKDRKFAFQGLKLYMIKEQKYVKNGVHYLNQIRKLLKDFNITTTIVKKDRVYIRGRDTSTMIQLYFVIHSNYINLFNFLKNVGFLYTSKRLVDKKTFKKIRARAQFEIEKIKKYKQVLRLRKKGISAYKISKIINLPVHLVKYWVYKNGSPRMLSK